MIISYEITIIKTFNGRLPPTTAEFLPLVGTIFVSGIITNGTSGMRLALKKYLE
jgi:hypothetical protein